MMGAALMWMVIILAMCVIGMICKAPGWMIRKIRGRMEARGYRKQYRIYM